MQKKILIISSTFPRHKSDLVNPSVKNLAIELSKKYKITVLVPDSPQIYKSYLDKYKIKIKPFQYCPVRTTQKLAYGKGIIQNIKSNPLIAFQIIPFIISGVINLKRILKTQKPDAILSNWIIPSGLISVLSTKKTPIISIVHGSDINISSLPLRMLQRTALKRSKKVICVSENLKKKVNKICPSCHAITAPQGVRINRYNQGRNKNKLLYVGRIIKQKGVDKIISAFLLAKKKNSNISLDIIGPVGMIFNNELDESINILGPKSQSDLKKYYKNFGALVFFSQKQEGLPNVILEAASHGMPIITNNIPGSEGLINQKTANISKNNIIDLSEMILSVTSNYDAALKKSKTMHNTIKDEYSLKLSAKKISDQIDLI